MQASDPQDIEDDIDAINLFNDVANQVSITKKDGLHKFNNSSFNSFYINDVFENTFEYCFYNCKEFVQLIKIEFLTALLKQNEHE